MNDLNQDVKARRFKCRLMELLEEYNVCLQVRNTSDFDHDCHIFVEQDLMTEGRSFNDLDLGDSFNGGR